jgi:hypothetical protein
MSAKTQYTPNDSFEENLVILNNWMTYTTKNITKLNTNIFTEQSTLPIIMCCDGGLINNKGSYGIIATRNKVSMFECNNRTPYAYNMLSSHRSEAYGILIGITIIYNLYEHHRSTINHTR